MGTKLVEQTPQATRPLTTNSGGLGADTLISSPAFSRIIWVRISLVISQLPVGQVAEARPVTTPLNGDIHSHCDALDPTRCLIEPVSSLPIYRIRYYINGWGGNDLMFGQPGDAVLVCHNLARFRAPLGIQLLLAFGCPVPFDNCQVVKSDDLTE